MAKPVHLQAGKHTCLGALSPVAGLDTLDALDRDVMLVYSGEFESMDGPVTVTPEHLEGLCANHNAIAAVATRLAAEGGLPEYDLGMCPPLQLDHSTSAAVTVGRVVGPLKLGHVVVDGTSRRALFGKARVLGAENTPKARDGRWIHVSIGADLDAGKLNELSITPFPAAAMAAMLAKGKKRMAKKLSESEKEKLKKHLMEKEKLSEEECSKKLAALSDEDSEKHLAEAEDEEKKLAAEEDEKKAKMAAEEEEEKKKLAAEKEEADKKEKLTAKTNFVALCKDFRAGISGTQLSATKARISARLSKLQASAKITPAERKKVDLAKLAGSNEATIEAVLATYDKREPVILAGSLGSAKAVNLAKIEAEKKSAALEAETLANMPSLSKLKGKDAKKTKLAHEGASAAVSPAAGAAPLAEVGAMKSHLAEVGEMMAAGKHAEGVEHMRKLMEKVEGHLSGAPEAMEMSASAETEMSGLAENVKKLHNQFEEILKLVGPSFGVASSDLQ